MARRYYVLAALLVVLGIFGLVAAGQVLGPLTVTRLNGAAYLGSGLCAAVAAARGLGAMRLWGKVLGFGHLALAIAGFVMDGGMTAWLDLALAAFFLYHALLAPPTL